MITLRQQLLGLGFVAASSLLAIQSAQALTGPSAITIDGGPLGSLSLSGGVDGYGYYLGQTGSTSIFGRKSNGAYLANGLVELQKTSGILQFTIEIGSNGGAITLGTKPTDTSIRTFTTGPLYAGYITVAPPNLPITISAGQLASLEGYESGVDWNNPVQIVTSIFYVQNSQSRGISANYTAGPLSATVMFGDGFDDGVFNFAQALVSYTFNSTNVLDVYAAGNLGTTGLNTFGYGNSTTGANGAYYVNSDMIGAFYTYTMGDLVLIPEAQYVFSKKDDKIFLPKASANFGAAVFADYSFGSSPYSLGAWVNYSDSTGPDGWYVGPKSQTIGAAVSPTWQYKDLFVRGNAGALYLLSNKFDGVSYGYGNHDDGKYNFLATIEAGLLF